MKIDTKQDIEQLERGISNLERTKKDFAIKTTSELVDSIIVNEIHRRMRRANYDEKIIDATRLERVFFVNDKIKFRIVSDYISESGFKIADVRERTGTVDHDIEADESRETDSGRPPALELRPGIGEPLYRRKVHVRGIEATYIIETTMEELTPEVQKQYTLRENSWIKSNLGN